MRHPTLVGRVDGGVARNRTLRDLLRVVDELASRRDRPLVDDGMVGDKGVLSVEGHGFLLHVYFRGERVSFELFGPSEGLTGAMSVGCLRDVLRLSVVGSTPLELSHARSSEIEEATRD